MYFIETKKNGKVTGSRYVGEYGDSMPDDFHETRTHLIELMGTLKISTVFLGLEHMGGMLYETLVFDAGVQVGWPERYRNYEDAVAGHAKIVRQHKPSEEQVVAELHSLILDQYGKWLNRHGLRVETVNTENEKDAYNRASPTEQALFDYITKGMDLEVCGE